MKRIVATLALICVCHASFADTSGDWTYTVSNNQATITGYTGAGGAVTIPTEVNGIPVVKVGDGRFSLSGNMGNNTITSLTIPNSVTSVGDVAFFNCYGLASVTIGNSVTTIGRSAFLECRALTSLTIGDGVTNIGPNAFFRCQNLNSIILPTGLVSIGEFAFASCGIGGELFVPDSVQFIDIAAFSGCPLNKISLPEHLAVYLPFMRMETEGYEIPTRGVPEVVIRNRGNQYLYPAFLNQLANNTDFISTLANNDAFITAVANKIKGTVGTYGLATQSELGTLATKSEITTAINEGKASGIASVTASPNTWSLFTSSQIQNMAIGDLVLTREVNGNFVLNYDIEQSNDLANWTVYSANTQIVKLPADKAFVRIKAKQ